MIDRQQIVATLDSFDPSQSTTPAPLVETYWKHYGIDFSRQDVSVTQTIGTVESAGELLVCQLFKPQNPVASCFILHGYYDHVGLFGHLIAALLKHDIEVVAFDQPGHGLSSGEPASINSFFIYADSLEACMNCCQGKIQQPWHLVGQSTGAAVAMTYLLQRNAAAFDKVVLLAPLVRPSGWRYLKIIQPLLSTFLKKLPRNFAVNSSDSSFLTFVRELDPFQSKYLKLQWITAMRDWIRWFVQQPDHSKPMLVLQGEKDSTVDWAFNIDAIRRLFPQSVVQYFAEAGHHMVNESEELREEIFAVLVEELLADR
ncbi:MAG: alpha/beta fold hydrolase [Pseudomonadales bacterium]